MKTIKKLNLVLVIAVVIFITFASTSSPNLKRRESINEDQSSLVKRQYKCKAGYYPCRYGGCCYGTSFCYAYNKQYYCGLPPRCPVDCGDGTCCLSGFYCSSDGYCTR
ncbi:4788_t:CDS:1, partial [Funneliformis mosseae]